jgi:hypothetical protein
VLDAAAMRIRNSSLVAAVVFLATAKLLAQDTRAPSDAAAERELRDLARRDRSPLQACYASVEQHHPHAWRSVTDVQVPLAPDGAVGHVTIHGARDVAPALERCVNPITANWHLQHAPPAATTLTLGRDRLRAAYESLRR